VPIIAIVVLAAGTFAFRLAGPAFHDRLQPSEQAQRLLTIAAGVLLTALVATSALIQGEHFAGWARTLGVAVAIVLAVRRAPFPIVVIAAAGTAAALRLLGIS
jgi:branched-subunit amino acid transport protein